MGIFDIFSGGKSGIARTVVKANNKHAQSVDRWKALEALREDASDEAISGLLRRFTFAYDKSIEDEQEKEWVHDVLVEMGEKILGPLQKALISHDTIAWTLRVLEHVATEEQAFPILEKVIEANPPEYVRDASRKIQLIDFLGERRDPRLAKALLQYLEDIDEPVRFHTVEAILRQKNEEVGREPLLQLALKPEEESLRIKVRILDGLADVGWNTHGFKGAVEKLCEELGRGHAIDNKGRIRRPTPKG